MPDAIRTTGLALATDGLTDEMKGIITAGGLCKLAAGGQIIFT